MRACQAASATAVTEKKKDSARDCILGLLGVSRNFRQMVLEQLGDEFLPSAEGNPALEFGIELQIHAGYEGLGEADGLFDRAVGFAGARHSYLQASQSMIRERNVELAG